METWGWWGLLRESKNVSPGTHLVFSTHWQCFVRIETDCITTIISEKVNLAGDSHLIHPHHLLTASFRGQDNLWGSLQLLCADNSATFVISLFTAISGAVPPDNENNCTDMLNQTFANAHCINPVWPSPSSPSNTPHSVIHTSTILLAWVDPLWKKAFPRIGLLRSEMEQKPQN